MGLRFCFVFNIYSFAAPGLSCSLRDPSLPRVSFVDGIYDTEIEPIQGNGLKWSASDNVEDIARELYANEIALPGGATQYVSYEFSLNESLSPGMPSYLNEVRTVSVQASITIHYREREIEGGQVHWTNEFEIFNNQTVTVTFTAVPA